MELAVLLCGLTMVNDFQQRSGKATSVGNNEPQNVNSALTITSKIVMVKLNI
jgi:hypothetical protein